MASYGRNAISDASTVKNRCTCLLLYGNIVYKKLSGCLWYYTEVHTNAERYYYGLSRYIKTLKHLGIKNQIHEDVAERFLFHMRCCSSPNSPYTASCVPLIIISHRLVGQSVWNCRKFLKKYTVMNFRAVEIWGHSISPSLLRSYSLTIASKTVTSATESRPGN